MKKLFVIFVVLYSIDAFAYYTQNIPDSCGAFARNEMYAVFTPNQYTCSVGQFLPANTLGCALCPADYTCDGGTFDFNADKNQGLNYSTTVTHDLTNVCAKNAPNMMSAIFTPNTHTCSAGYIYRRTLMHAHCVRRIIFVLAEHILLTKQPIKVLLRAPRRHHMHRLVLIQYVTRTYCTLTMALYICVRQN